MPTPRVLRFPTHRSMGWLRGQQAGLHDPKGGALLGDAQGDVAVPAHLDVRLIVESEAARDLSFLTRIQAGDLQDLLLVQTQVTDDQLPHVAHLTGLRLLSLSDTDVTDAALLPLRPLSALRVLHMWWCRGITDAAMPHLLALRGLEHVTLGRSSVTDAGVARLAEHPSLKLLSLEDCRVTRGAVAALQRQRPDLRIQHSASLD
jgi:hypothetical protein